ncbi:flavin reductase family protein [Corynebacterium hansenii]|uniref:Flavin reductase family protein n=1 Tax=Corynebacterium hansenii TaxID=394964 RepID=A0ABV7ZRC5_9CORY|nr:flavin reductase family protein [Corynebacterium hansenii]WJZ01008.1 Flavin-dependent monooxygenase, reductase subunit HsaB [Corynebacterium hansenii]
MTNADTRPAPLETMDEMSIRKAFGEFATGVTIVASDDGEPVGFACQSFSSLSLNPPLVLFTVMNTSRSWPRIRATGRFSVSVLTEAQRDISAVFGRRGRDKFEHGEWTRSALGNPLLRDCAVWIDCTIEDVHEAGDHFIVVGRVAEIGHRADSRPLLYHRGSYANVVAAGEDAPADESWRQRPSV